jgi:hypothetical protein
MSEFNNTDKPIGLASDHAGFDAKSYIIKAITDMGLKYKDFGTYSTESTDYADYAHPMATAVESGEGQLFAGTLRLRFMHELTMMLMCYLFRGGFLIMKSFGKFLKYS